MPQWSASASPFFSGCGKRNEKGEYGVTFLSTLSTMSLRCCCLLLILLTPLAQAETLLGRVIAIADGDTLTILDAANRSYKIRLAGIDSPE